MNLSRMMVFVVVFAVLGGVVAWLIASTYVGAGIAVGAGIGPLMAITWPGTNTAQSRRRRD